MNVVPTVSATVLGRTSGVDHRGTTRAPLVPSHAMVKLTTTLITAVTPRALMRIHRRFAAGMVDQSERQRPIVEPGVSCRIGRLLSASSRDDGSDAASLRGEQGRVLKSAGRDGG